MNWFSNVPVPIRAFVFAVIVVALGIATVLGVISVNDWLVGNYGQEMSETIWAVGVILVMLTGISWFWQCLD